MFGKDCPDEMEGFYCTTELNFLQSLLDLTKCIDVDEPLLLGEVW